MSTDIEAFPRAATAGREVQLHLAGCYGSPLFQPDRPFRARWFSQVDRTDDAQADARCQADGTLQCALRFACPGEYVLELRAPGEEKLLLSERFFAVRPALAGLRPYKGDMHIHTCGSDGRQPGLAMALASRALGMDFIAITDHDNYAPAVQTAEEARRAGLGLVVLPGEEITIRVVGGHILALNASQGVSRLCKGEVYDTERAALVRGELGARKLIPPLTPDGYAHAVWTVRKIRECGGAALLAHPYWVGTNNKFYPPPAVCHQLLEDGLCDGLELAGGSPSTEGNLLAVARYGDDLARGRRWPIVGGSDAHQDAELAKLWTMIFARELNPGSMLQAILGLNSVACDQRHAAEVAIYGPFELVEYAYFLHREFFPLHDALCRTQAGLAAGLDGAAAQPLAEAFRNLYARFWDEEQA